MTTHTQKILDLLSEIDFDKDLQQRSSTLSFLSNEIRARQDRLDKEIFSQSSKFLPQDLREEMEQYLAEYELEGVEGCDYCADTDFSSVSDDDLLDRYSDMVDGDEEDEQLQKGLGYQAELEMLSQKTVG